MIVPNQQNIKVHFAGLENQDFAMILTEISKIKYGLFTVFPFIAHKFGIKPLKMKSCTPESALYLQNAHRHTIMDSGLFTLMFGAHAGKRDEPFVERWMNEIINFTNEIGYKGTVVEVDCQKILGVEKAWEYRERMKKELPNNRQINVFHKEDGQKGLDRLIEFADYIAVSVPELRALGKKQHTERLVHYIKNKKPSIDIHLLGCTENKLLHNLKFCSSADSTSWQQVNRYGHLKYHNGKKTFSAKNSDISIDKMKERFGQQLTNIIEKYIECTDKRYDYYSKYALAGQMLKHQYTIQAGSQD